MIIKDDTKIFKALNYDLDLNKVKLFYPNKKSYTKAWKEVKDFLCSNGFENRQYSGVVSNKMMDNLEVIDIIKRLFNEKQWLKKCVIKFDVTNVGETYSVIDYLENETKIKQTLNNHDLELKEKLTTNIDKMLDEFNFNDISNINNQNEILQGKEI